MASTKEYVDYVCESVKEYGIIASKKMFGEYMVYINDKPIILICDNTVFIKMKEEIKDLMQNAEQGFPYQGAKEHYILDVEDFELTRKVIPVLEKITEVPKKKKKKSPEAK